MTLDQAVVVMASLRTLWPESFGFGSEAVRGAWCRELTSYDYDAVTATVRRLSRELSRPPALADVLAGARHLRDQGTLSARLASPRQGCGWPSSEDLALVRQALEGGLSRRRQLGGPTS